MKGRREKQRRVDSRKEMTEEELTPMAELGRGFHILAAAPASLVGDESSIRDHCDQYLYLDPYLEFLS